MLQIITSVGSAVKGSRNAVSGCGTTSMSLSLIACQPRMLEPSKPSPFSNTSSSSLLAGIVKCCQSPGKSMKRKSTALTSCSRHKAKTSLGVTAPSFQLELGPKSLESAVVPKFRDFGQESIIGNLGFVATHWQTGFFDLRHGAGVPAP